MNIESKYLTCFLPLLKTVDAGRLQLQGVHVIHKADSILFVATNGKMLACLCHNLPNNPEAGTSYTIPDTMIEEHEKLKNWQYEVDHIDGKITMRCSLITTTGIAHQGFPASWVQTIPSELEQPKNFTYDVVWFSILEKMAKKFHKRNFDTYLNLMQNVGKWENSERGFAQFMKWPEFFAVIMPVRNKNQEFATLPEWLNTKEEVKS